MNKFKKILCLVLTAVMLAATFAFTPAYAAEDCGYTYSMFYDKNDGVVTLEISALGDESMLGVVGVMYDPEALTLVDNDGNAVDEYTSILDYQNKVLNFSTTVGKYETGLYFLSSNGKKDAASGTDNEKNVDTENGRFYFAWSTGFTEDSKNILLDDGYLLATVNFEVNDADLVEELVSKGKLITLVDKKCENAFYSHRAYLSFEGRRNYSADKKPYITIKYEYEGFENAPTEVEISILVKGEDGKPVEGAKVTLGGKSVTTGEDGIATFVCMAGDYTYSVEMDGYISFSGNVSASGETAEAEAEIEKISTPAAPTMSDFTSVTKTSLNVRWKKVTDNGGADITKYVIEYGTSKTNLNKTAELKITDANEGTSTLSKSITGLNSGTTYYFRVAAVNSAGTGEFSDIKSVKTNSEGGGSTGGGGTDTITTKYTVTYNAGSGKIASGSKTEQVVKGSYPKNPPTVTPPAGMIFDGWMNGNKKVVLSELRIAGNMTLTASYVKAPEEHKPFLNGYNENGTTLAKPGNNITRAEAVTIISRITPGFDENGTYTTATALTDVGTKWYAKYINFAVSKGLVTGYPDGTFKPDNPISREEFVTIVFRLAGYAADNSKTFSDVPDGHWAKANISTLAAKGLVGGYPDGTFGLCRKITRAEVVTIINRYLEREPDAELVKAYYKGKTLPASDIETHWAFAQMVEAMSEHTVGSFHK